MGGKTTTSSQQVTIPPEVLARYNAVNARAETVSDKPFQIYSTDPSAFVAPLTQPQQTGIRQSEQYAQTAQPFFQEATGRLIGAQEGAQPFMGEATGLARAGARGVSPGELQTQQFMSPYIRSVVDAQRALTEQQQQAQMSGQTGQAIRAGAFGGDRAGIAAANLAAQQQLAQAGITAPLLQQGYSQALQTAQQQQGLGLSAEQANRAAQAQAAQQIAGLGGQQFAMGTQTAQGLAGLGTGAQQAGLQGAQAQMAAGQMQQQTEQAGLQALYNQFLQQQSYPFQVAQFLANIAMGTGALSGSTTTGRQPGGFFSDERLKENVREVGELHDGQKVYAYNYRGEDGKTGTRLGLIAQEVEDKKPEAIGLAGGYRTVNYDKATKDAASMGGGVKPHHEGEPFARGGYADGGSPLLSGLGGADMAALLQAQQQMYSPYGGAGPYGMSSSGGMYGGGAYVPEASLPVTGLAAPAPLPEQPSALETMNQMAQLGKSAGDIYAGGKKQGWWGKEETSTTTTPGGVAGGESAAPMNVTQAEAKARLEAESGGPPRRIGPPMASGGVAGNRVAAQDGGSMPYSGGSGQGLSIPQQAGDQNLSLNAPSLPQQGPSPFEKLVGLAGTAGSVMGGLGAMGLGFGKAEGGEVAGVDPYERTKGLNIPSDIKTPEPLKGPELNKGRTPFEDMQDVARMAAMFMAEGGRAGYQMGGAPEETERQAPDLGFVGNLINSVYGAQLPFPGSRAAEQQKPPPPTDFRVDGVAAGEASRAPQAPRPRPSTPTGVAPPREAVAQGYTPPAYTGGLAGTSAPAMMSPAGIAPAQARQEQVYNPATQKYEPREIMGLQQAIKPTGVIPERGRLRGAYDTAIEKAKGMGLNKAENLIPLLSGIAAMGVAPTRSLGVALASGLGAGTQAYLPTRQAMEDIRATQAGTKRTEAEAGRLRASTAATEAEAWNALQKSYTDRGFRLVEDPNGPIANPFGRFRAVPILGGGDAVSVAQLAAQADPRIMRADGAQYIAEQMMTSAYQGMMPDEIKANRAEFTQALETLPEFQRAQQSVAKLGIELQKFAEGDIAPGTLSNLRVEAFRLANTFLRGINSDLRIDEDNVTQADIIAKLQQEIADTNSERAGGDNIQNMLAHLRATPGIQMTPDAAQSLWADMMTVSRRGLDRGSYLVEAGKMAGRANPALQNAIPLGIALVGYAKDYPTVTYVNESGDLKSLMQSGQYSAWRSALSSGDARAAQQARDALTATFPRSPYLWRYLTGEL